MANPMAIPKVFSGRVGTPINWPDGSSGGGMSGQLTDDQLDALLGTSGAPAAGNKFVTNSDFRLTNARTPGAHAPTHKAGGSDQILLDEFGAPLDRTLLDATPARHGLLPKLSGQGWQYLDGSGGWSQPPVPAIVVPTGTGFRHVTAGVEDPATKLVENADVAALAAIVEAKLSLNFPTHAENHAARHLLAGGDSLLLTNNEIAVGAAIAEAKLNLNFATHAENHAARHGPAPAADPLRLDDLEVPQNNTDLNASITAHGLCPLLSNVATNFLNGVGGWTDPPAGLLLSGSAYVVIGGSANSTTNGTALVAAYAAATAKTPHGAALAANNRYTIYLLPGVYTLTSAALVMSAQFIDLVGIGGTPHNIILTSNGTTLSASGNDLVIANLRIHTSVAGVATLNTNDYAFYPTSGLTGHKLIGVVFDADDQTINRGMRCGVTYAGIYIDCISATDRGFGCWCGTTPGVASGYFVNCEANRMGFGMGVGSASAVVGTATGVFWKCRCSGGGFGGNGNASGTFTYCQTWSAFQNAYANCQATGDSACFGGGNTGAAISASGVFTFCSCASGASFGYNIQANAGVASGTFKDCHSGAIRAFGSTLFSGTAYNCTALGTSFGSGTGSSITGQLFNCTAYGDTAFAGGGGSMSAAAVLYNCIGQNYCFTGRNGGAGGAIAGLLVNCSGVSTCFASGTSGGAMSGTLSGCRCSAGFNPTLTGNIRLCDFPTGNDNLIVTALNPAADVTAFTSQVTTNLNAGSAVGFYGLFGGTVHSSVQALTLNAMTSFYTQAGLVGCKAQNVITAAATVTSVIGFGVQNLIRGGCTVTHCIGLLSTPFYNDLGAGNTVDSAYGLVVKSCMINVGVTLNNVYGMYLADQQFGTNRWGVYQLGATNKNYFAGWVGLNVAPTTMLHLVEAPTLTAVTNITSQVLVAPSQADNTGTDYIALKIQQNTATANNFSATGAGYGIVGVLCQAGSGAAGAGTHSLITGAWIRCFKNGAGVVAEMNALHLQVQNNVANALTLSRSLYVEAPQLVTGTIGTNYGIYIADQKPAGVTTGYGVYQLGTTSLNLFQGQVILGVASGAGANGQALDSGPTSTLTVGTYQWGSVVPLFNPAGASSATFTGIFMQPQTTGAQNFSGTITGINMQALHYGTGSCTLLVGGDFAVRKVTTGAVTSMVALRTYSINANATAQVGTAYGLWCQTPLLIGVGFITTNYGVYIDDQKPAGVTTGWGIYQIGATTLNYYAGKVGVAMSPVNTLDVTGTFGVTSTAAIGGVLTMSAGVVHAIVSYSAAGALAITTAHYCVLCDTTANDVTCNLPTAVGITGRVVAFKKLVAANNMRIIPNGAETIDGAANYITAVQWNSVTLISNGANWFLI